MQSHSLKNLWRVAVEVARAAWWRITRVAKAAFASQRRRMRA
jgi:hypothetical protein